MTASPPPAAEPAVEPGAEPVPTDVPDAIGASADVVAPVAQLAPPAPAPPAFVYALGQVEARLPSLSLEKELAQAIGSSDYAGLTDRRAVSSALRERANRYIARAMCWVFVVEGLETYVLVPRDPADLDLLVDAYREAPRRDDLDLVIGTRGGIAPPEMCGGLTLPVVVFDQLYSFDRAALIDSIPRDESLGGRRRERFDEVAGGLLDELAQMADNAGALDEHRALNYLMVRYPRIYTAATEQAERNFSATGVEVVPSSLSGARTIVDVVFSWRHRETDVVEKRFVRVDVTEQFPFLVTKLSPYYER